MRTAIKARTKEPTTLDAILGVIAGGTSLWLWYRLFEMVR